MTCQGRKEGSWEAKRVAPSTQNGEPSRNPAAMANAPNMGPKHCPAPQILKAKHCPDFSQDARTPWGRVSLKTLLDKAY